MTALVFGQSGQVATELAKLPDITCFGRQHADLSDPKACADLIRTQAPTAVINAAAYTAVDRAEIEEALALTINAQAPAAMARACADLGIPFVHISTDYVFAGDGTVPWKETDPVAPRNAYGRTKLAGEDAVRAVGGAHVILRTSWVVSAYGNNFVKTMLRLGADRDTLNIVGDQIGGPTPARDIAVACHKIAQTLSSKPDKSGTYHFSGGPDVSWACFARETFTQSGITCQVTDIPTSDYPTPAVRPLNSRLDCAAVQVSFGISQPEWKQGLADILTTLR
jgi:dTDP-4-dehydrorhamnose reductase